MSNEKTKMIFSDYKVVITDEFSEPEPLITQGDKIIVSKGNIATIIGKPKAFKTFLTSAIVAGFLEDETLSISGVGGTCLFIDTEQSRSHVNTVQKRIYKLCNWDTEEINNRLIMLSLRELSYDDRLQMLLDATDTIKPDLIIIDGIRDLVKDFNDLKESAEIVGHLMAISSQNQCAIITVLHQNKSDSNARGHLGSELSNKSETVLQVVNDSGMATVSPIYSRNQEIEPFSFRVDTNSLPTICRLPKIEKKVSELGQLMHKAMFGSAWIDKKTLVRKLVTLITKSERTAERKIKDALEANILKYNDAGSLILNTSTIEEKDNELPF